MSFLTSTKSREASLLGWKWTMDGVLVIFVAGEQMVVVFLDTVTIGCLSVCIHGGFIQRDLHLAHGEGVRNRIGCGQVGKCTEYGAATSSTAPKVRSNALFLVFM